jgi:hypothetical protein
MVSGTPDHRPGPLCLTQSRQGAKPQGTDLGTLPLRVLILKTIIRRSDDLGRLANDLGIRLNDLGRLSSPAGILRSPAGRRASPAGRFGNDLGRLPSPAGILPNDLGCLPDDAGILANDLPFSSGNQGRSASGVLYLDNYLVFLWFLPGCT